jgi:CheY-like chemotaxis protein
MNSPDSQTGAAQIQPGAATAHPPEPATVLLVEDDPALRRYLEVLLRRSGFTVITAADGLEAIKIAFTANVSAVVTDAVMPRLGGPELCRIIRSNKQLARLPLVLLSGLAAKEQAPAAVEHADAHLTKPVRPAELVECLRRLIARAD